MHIGTRLKQWIENKSLTAIEFSEEVGIQRSSLSHLFSGRNKPSVDVLIKIKNTYPEIDLEWLITGIEAINKTESPPTISESEINEFTDVNIDAYSSDTEYNDGDTESNRSRLKNEIKLIRIIEIYSDNTFKNYEV